MRAANKLNDARFLGRRAFKLNRRFAVARMQPAARLFDSEVFVVGLDVFSAVARGGFFFCQVFEKIPRLATEELAERVEGLYTQSTNLAGLDARDGLDGPPDLARKLSRLHLALRKQFIQIEHYQRGPQPQLAFDLF